MRIIEVLFLFLCHYLLQFFLIRNRTDFALKSLEIFMLISYFIETENEKSFLIFQSCSLACVLMLRQTCFKICPLSNFCYSSEGSSLCTMYFLLHLPYNSMTSDPSESVGLFFMFTIILYRQHLHTSGPMSEIKMEKYQEEVYLSCLVDLKPNK